MNWLANWPTCPSLSTSLLANMLPGTNFETQTVHVLNYLSRLNIKWFLEKKLGPLTLIHIDTKRYMDMYCGNMKFILSVDNFIFPTNQPSMHCSVYYPKNVLLHKNRAVNSNVFHDNWHIIMNLSVTFSLYNQHCGHSSTVPRTSFLCLLISCLYNVLKIFGYQYCHLYFIGLLALLILYFENNMGSKW